MKKAYLEPTLHEFGDLVAHTGFFGGPAAGDVVLDANGNPDLSDQNSVDGCAERGGKCICADNGTC